ncbi:SnoaL-like domain [Shewanella psychrophila]|uniref:SnoaL-like domain n=1 Tax=Shewanella psychrophila TaxID=225848 RepID=A0A1S6HLI4_9GAMM|nr:DUF4440 domain-containing protein [Shewanella psychrophila]AQS36391.1 SnoaL-like domain [Shewanella psychrophila]
MPRYHKKQWRCFLGLFLGLVLLLGVNYSGLVLAHGDEEHQAATKVFMGMDQPVTKVVSEFHRAIQTGNEASVKRILAKNVLIYEGGNVERSLLEYASHHMQADMAYLKGLTVIMIEQQIQVYGNTAISTSVTKSSGLYKGKSIDSQGMETLVLNKETGGEWQIVHIHWSN